MYFKAGKTAYAAGRYADAVKLFAEGYRLDPQPAFLLNIAQSHRSNGNARAALEYYRKYLEADRSSAVRAQVEDLIRDLEKKIHAEEASQPRAAPPASAVAPPPAPASQPEPERPRAGAPFYHRWWFWTAVGAVVVGTTVGIAAYYGGREPSYVKEGGLGAVRW